MTRVKIFSKSTLAALEIDVNQAIEAIEAQGYGVKSIRYQVDRIHMPSALIVYGNGPMTTKTNPR